jgi:transposase InsO family protein
MKRWKLSTSAKTTIF